VERPRQLSYPRWSSRRYDPGRHQARGNRPAHSVSCRWEPPSPPTVGADRRQVFPQGRGDLAGLGSAGRALPGYVGTRDPCDRGGSEAYRDDKHWQRPRSGASL